MKVPALLLFCALLLSACGSFSRVPFTIGNSGQTLRIDEGESFQVQLMTNAATDARWHVQNVDTSVVQQRGAPETYIRSGVGGLARLMEYTYTFRAVGEGTTELRLELRDPGKTEAIETFTMTVVVD